jgi:ketosteroid isomerase-like protein
VPSSETNLRLARRLAATAIVLTASLTASVALAAPADAPARSSAATPSADSASVVRTVERFHEALATGDSAGALALLAPDAAILESGGIESVADYRAHHLPADIEFARAVPGTRGPVRVTVRGDVAWASSTSDTKGEFRGRPVNSAGAELMVLTRVGSDWRISAIHWSSRTRRQ